MANNAGNAIQNNALIEAATRKAMSPFRTDKLVSWGDFREFVGLSQSGMFDLLARGELPPSFKIGRRRFFDPADLHEWLQARKSAA